MAATQTDLIMIPALGCDGELYKDIEPGLSDLVKPRTIIATGNRIARCVEEVLAQAPDEFIILGTSFGGRVALEMALAASNRVKGLWIIGSGPHAAADPAAGRRRSARLRSNEFEAVIDDMGDMVAYLSGPNGLATREAFLRMAHSLGGEVMARQSDAMAERDDVTARLSEIACPAFMLWGREDRFSPPQDGLQLAMSLANARFVEIPACGHFPTLEAPGETLDAARHWLHASGLSAK